MKYGGFFQQAASVPASRWLAFVGAALVAVLPTGRVSFGQPPASDAPQPEVVELRTDDQVVLKATYYPGSKGKETIPIVMLHGYEGNRRHFHDLAVFFQHPDFLGAAVLVPDLRGHGDSTLVTGSNRPLKAETLNAAQFKAMVAYDMKACRKFLMDKHRKGEVNIELLTLIGADMGASVAFLYGKADWMWPMLATGKQGQDVRAVAMISPQASFKGLNLSDGLADPDPFGYRQQVSFFVAVGQDDQRLMRAAERFDKQLLRFRPGENPANPQDATIFFQPFPTKLQGTKILDEPSYKLHDRLADFVQWRVQARAADFPWKPRDAIQGN